MELSERKCTSSGQFQTKKTAVEGLKLDSSEKNQRFVQVSICRDVHLMSERY